MALTPLARFSATPVQHACNETAHSLPATPWDAPSAVRGTAIPTITQAQNREVILDSSFFLSLHVRQSQAPFLLFNVSDICPLHPTLLPPLTCRSVLISPDHGKQAPNCAPSLPPLPFATPYGSSENTLLCLSITCSKLNSY